jgi:hypothetical protein
MTAATPPHHPPTHGTGIPRQPAPAGQPATAEAVSAATRHLCVAAYQDETFQRTSLREVYHQTRRLTAPSHGFALIPVLWHCLRARNLALIRDGVIVGTLVVAACVSFLALVGVILQLLQLHFVIALGRLMRDAIRESRAGASGALLARALVILTGLALAGLVLVGSFFFIAYLLTAALGESLSGLSGEPADDAAGAVVGLGILLLVVVFGLPVADQLRRQHAIEQFVPGGQLGTPPRSARFDEIYWQQQGNTVVYSGYNPFVGAGEIINSWGFAERLVRPESGPDGPRPEREREFERIPFTASEISTRVAGDLRALVDHPEPERRIPGLTVTDRVFKAGTEVSQLWPMTEPAELATIIQNPTTPARHYLTCQVVSWRGELVTTVYVHFAVQGRSLYLEVTTAALPPCQDRYRIVDTVDGSGPVAYLRAAGRGILDTPRTVWMAPVNLLRAAYDALAAAAARGRQSTVRGFDYGAQVSVRELAASEITRNHTQTQDIIKHLRLIERRVMATVLDFLEERGVDTTEHRQRAQTVLNAGALVIGGGTLQVGTATGQQNVAAPTPRATARS